MYLVDGFICELFEKKEKDNYIHIQLVKKTWGNVHVISEKEANEDFQKSRKEGFPEILKSTITKRRNFRGKTQIFL